ncbi:MAG: uncharacterized protein JWM09_1375 [Francisellaceae bacterium]|nr:uncharacterized protein [Francisellaceae bacterium]
MPKEQVNFNEPPSFWVYILYCANGSLYTGYTNHLLRRYFLHVTRKGAKYTISFPPKYLAQVWPCYGTIKSAMQLEFFIKKMNKKNKLLIIEQPHLLEKLWHKKRFDE